MTYTGFAFPKPKMKKGNSHKAKNNPVPTYEQVCRYCGRHFAQTHEVFEGSGRRQLSIMYGMQVHLCHECHEEVQHKPLQGKDLELKQEFQRRFESKYGHDFFMKTFMYNYLDEYEWCLLTSNVVNAYMGGHYDKIRTKQNRCY